MSGRFRIISVLLLFFAAALLGMDSRPDPDKGDAIYRFPMNGGEFLLSGTFGELRNNHFYSGIDIKTGGEIGVPLYAVRDGYIYRIKVSPYGFGKAIYLRHADGQFSVFGHMNQFNPEIEEFVYRKQYASRKYEQEIYLPENQMPVRQGQLIGYSGNSGSSLGPHLHFEIRDPDERITNPLKYYRHLVQDHKKPLIRTIGFEPLELGSRVNGQFEKLEVVPEGRDGRYSIANVVEVSGKVGLEYHAYDLLDGAGNHCGVNYAKLYLDDKQVFEFAIDRFAFDEKKYINVHFDYPYYKRKGKKFQKCYLENGNSFGSYKNLVNGGVIELEDDKVHRIRLELSDSYKNTSVLTARVRRVSSRHNLPSKLSYPGITTLKGYSKRNIIVTKVKNPSTAHLRGLDVKYIDNEIEKLRPAYFINDELVYLHNIDKWKLPQEVRDPVTGKRVDFSFLKTVLPDKNNIVELGELQAYFPYTSVFDTLPLRVKRYPGNSRMYSDIYEIGSNEVPLLKSFVLNFVPKKKASPQHMVIAKQRKNGSWSFLGNEIKEDGSIYASSGHFGTFCVMADSTRPRIKPLNFSDGKKIGGQSSLTLKITDNFAGINSQKIHCTLDGEWTLFAFDAKSSTIRHKIRHRPSPGKHTLHIMVYDNANNLAEQSFTIYF